MKQTHISLNSKKIQEGRTDWSQIKKLSDKKVIKAAMSDPDAPPLSKHQLEKFRRVSLPLQINVQQVRQKLRISQSEFAGFFGISLRTLQEWEQGRRIPKGPARALLIVITYQPQAVQMALRKLDSHTIKT